MLRYLAPVAVFAALVAMFFVGLGKDPSYVPSPLIGRPAPTFSLPRLDDPALRLTQADLRGRFVLVNVWATWCSGCRQEHEALMQIAKQGEVPIYGLNWKDEATDQARRWLEALGDPYTAVGVDADGRAAIDWGVYGAPETFLVDPDGIVRHKHIGPLTLETWQEAFLPRIRGRRAP